MAAAAMSVVYVLTTPIPEDGENATVDQIRMRNKKELWDSLEAKYIAEDASNKKFHELTLVELGSHLCIEESLMAQDSDKPKGNNVVGPQFCYVYLLHTKDEALDKFKVFKTEVELQQGSLIKRFWTDRGGLGQRFWGEVMLTACYILNRVPNKRNMIALYELWTKRKSNLNYLRVWGCREVVRLPDPKLMHLWNAIFDENRFSSVPRPSLSIPKEDGDIGGSWSLKRSLKRLQTSWLQMNLQKKTEVARISTIRLLIAMTSIHNQIIHQIDVKTAFLNDELDEEVGMTKEFLSSRFSMKDMVEADVIFGIRIRHEMGKLSRYTRNPGTQHWQAIQRVLKQFIYQWMGILAWWRSNFWASRKQTCIIGSTMESEFVALAAAGKEAEWLRNLILEIPLWPKPITPIYIRCDSAATLTKAYSQMYNEKSRRLGVKHNMICELITNGVVSIEFVRSQKNLADHLTKGLARDLVLKSAEGMGPNSLLRKLDGGDDATVEQIRKRAKWDNDDYVCRGLILKMVSLRVQDSDKPKGNNVAVSSVVNMVKHNNSSSIYLSTSKLNDSIPWHARLGHVHFKRMQDVSKDGLISELVHSDLCDLHATPSLRNIKYFVTFIDDASWVPDQSISGLDGRPVVRLPDTKLKTLGERGIECIFVGYAEHSKAFRFYVIEPNDSKEAVNDELDSIKGNNTWVLADLPPVSTPIDTSEKPMPNNAQTVSQLEYSRVIGYLMYAMTCTRLDIAFAIGKLSRYTSNPGTQHWQKIQRVLKYLKKTIDYELTYTGYLSMLKGVISWASKNQTCITGSTMKSEFVALAAAGKEAEWLRNLILEIPL
ncbi:zinc finger, CCHC-type containing protein [Tanacetum coccineum]|uniref:Zinc finger, CCHC-type containing protein n=1 Tax=Tanacetum coccineum TaxID=301880 RepID=A0ABQ5FBL1_9ASTR